MRLRLSLINTNKDNAGRKLLIINLNFAANYHVIFSSVDSYDVATLCSGKPLPI